MTDTVLDVEQIKQLLPHRAPMLLVEKLADIVPRESATGYKAVSINEPWFMGHFPDKAVMPGVLIVEAMAQTAGALVVHSVSGKTGQVVDAMRRVSSDVNDNAEISHTTRKLLADIVTAASEVTRLIQHTADATREQTDASHGTAVAMEKISQISESNSARMHGIGAAAANLNGIAGNLQTLVDRFRLS